MLLLSLVIQVTCIKRQGNAHENLFWVQVVILKFKYFDAIVTRMYLTLKNKK